MAKKKSSLRSAAPSGDWRTCVSYTLDVRRGPNTFRFVFLAKDDSGTEHCLEADFPTDDQQLAKKLLGLLQTTWPGNRIKFRSTVPNQGPPQITEIDTT